MPAARNRRRSDRQLRSLPQLRNSERGAFKKCRWLWDISYNRHLSAKTSVPALRFGTLIHESLAPYYKVGVKRGPNPIVTFERLYKADVKKAYSFGWRDEDGKWSDAGELGVAMLTNYLNTYGSDEDWEVLVTEHPYQTIVNHPETGKPWFQQVGILDGVWRHRSKKDTTIIIDHKTAASINTRYLALDDQAGSYWTWGVDYLYAKKLLSPGVKLNGMIFNFLRKAMPDERPTNELGQHLNKPTAKEKKEFGPDYPGSVSKVQPPPYFLRHYTWRDEYDREMQRTSATAEYAEIEAIRSGKMAIYKTPGAMTCGGCWLLDACELHETGNDWEEFLSQTSQGWEPYDQHSIEIGR